MNIKKINGHDQRDRLWQESEQLKFVKDLKAGKTVAEIMAGLDLESAFKDQPDELGCCDGRICHHRFGLAGECVLLTPDEQAEFIRRHRGKIKVVTSHDGCGAAAIKFRQLEEKGEFLPIGVTTPDQLGARYCQELAMKLGAEYRHTSARELSGPVHNERAIYLDGTGRFNPGALKELPAGFICSGPALGLGPGYIRTEIETLAGIALGDNGFGVRFNQDNPIYVVISADNQDQLGTLKQVAGRAAEKFAGRLAVDGFVVG